MWFYKEYIKYKILSAIKDRLIFYINESKNSISSLELFKNKEFTTSKCETKEMFDSRKKEGISYFHSQYIMNKNKEDVIKEIIEIIEKQK